MLARILLALLLTCGGCLAQSRGGAQPDPFLLRDLLSPNQNTKVVAPVTTTLNTGVRNLVLIVAGQSNVSDLMPSAYTPSNPTKIGNFNVRDGQVYAAADPLIGPSYPLTLGVPTNGPGNFALRLADNLITSSVFDYVMLVPVGVGSTSVADWAPGGFLGNMLPVTMQRLAAAGLVAGTNVTVAVIWGQGETDTQNGTTTAAYTASMNAVIAAARVAGFAGRFFVASQSWNVGAGSSLVTAAQAAVVNNPSSVFAGLNSDALVGNACNGTSACRQADNTHYSDAGAISAASGWQTALHASGAPF